MTLIAIEEHWMLPELASALSGLDEILAFNEMGDHQQRLEDLGAGRLAAMDAQGIDISVLALTPPGTQPLPPQEALRLSQAANDAAAAPGEVPGLRSMKRITALSSGVHDCPAKAGSLAAWICRPTARIRSASSNSRDVCSSSMSPC